MFKNYLEYIQGIILIHMKGMCSPEKLIRVTIRKKHIVI